MAGWDLGRLVKTGVGAFRAVAAVSLCRRVFVYMIYWGVCVIFLSTGSYLNGPTCHLELFSAEYDYKAYRRYYL